MSQSKNKITPILEMRNISKTFGSVSALKNVSFSVLPGEIHSLMGENGAGKSTLMKILSGAYTADPGGSVLVDGQVVETGNPKVSRKLGVSVIYQELSLAPNLTVAENIFLGNELTRFGFVDRKAMEQKAKPVLHQLDVNFDVYDKVSSLSLGERQEVEIARALASDARILVMDEPTTSLSLRETENIFSVIKRLKAQGITFVYISHRMQEIYELSDRCSVLRDGLSVGTLDRNELTADRLVSMMVGRDLESFYKKEHSNANISSDPVLSVVDLSDGTLVNNCSLDVYGGEVVGISGLVGSGRTELARLIYGADRTTSGDIFINGKKLSLHSPRDALAAGIVYLTEDRKELGMFLDMSISENINISVLEKDAKSGWFLDFAKAAKRADSAMDQLSIRADSSQQNTGALSGGNQQKVLLARLLETQPKVIILDEPTRGVDVGAKSEIYKLIDSLSTQGIAVVVISSDLPEIIGICDRILVMRDGQIQGEVKGNENSSFDQEEIMMLSTGASKSIA